MPLITTAAEFNGTTSVIEIPDIAKLHVGNVFSVEAWIYPTNLATRAPIFSTRKTNQPESWGIEVGNGFAPAAVAFTSVGTWMAVTNSNTVNTNVWQHIVYTRDGVLSLGHQNIYINGVLTPLQTEALQALTDNTDNKEIGVITPLASYFPGNLGEIAVYPTTLSAAQVQNHYAAASLPPCH